MKELNLKTRITTLLQKTATSQSNFEYKVDDNYVTVIGQMPSNVLSKINAFGATHYIDGQGNTVIETSNPLARTLSQKEIEIIDDLIKDLPVSLRIATYGIREFSKVGKIKFLTEADIFQMEFLLIENAIEHDIEEA